jgi:serine/threonine protein phosphatase PrpC
MDTVATVQVTAFTHQGRVRDSNEDTIAVGPWVRNQPMSIPHQWRLALETPFLCLVADGMGGQAAGEIASQHVAVRLTQEASQITGTDQLGFLLQKINAELYELMAAEPSRVGMGTTVAGIVLLEGHLIWFNVGDSRMYLYRNGFLRQITVDDVPEATRSREPSSKRQSSAITQSLGGTKAAQQPVPHLGTDNLAIPSRWLLCSDGITDMIDLDAMEACMAVPDLEAVTKLVSAAIKAGGEDNISAIILTITGEPGMALLSGL